jgi:GT2 family glycosyltransferase
VRIGYACRDVATDRLTGSGAEVYSLACATAAAGHEVFLICAELAGYRREPRGPVHVPLAPPRPGYRYLTGSLEYADRVYDTVRALDLDVLEAVDTAGEAYTVVRAKRLLGEFGATHIVVAAHPWSRSPAGEPPASLAQAVDRHLEEYCRRHADEVVTGRAVVAGGELLPEPSAAGAGSPNTLPAGDPAALRAVLAVDTPIPVFAQPPAQALPSPPPARPAPSARLAPPSVDGPLATVVIPIRDQGRFLGEAVASARSCGYAPLEIVVVDDGSTELETLAAIDALTDVRVVRQRNRGLPAARNAGIAVARGEYVVPLDADDLLPAGFLTAGALALQRVPELGCVGGTIHNFGLLDQVGSPVGYVPDVSLVVNTFGRATAVFRTAAVRAVGGYDETLPAYEDWDLYLRLHKAGYGVECAPVPAQRYRRHAESMTFQQNAAERLALTQRLLRTHADLLREDGALSLLLTLVQLWKSGYEPSASVGLRHGLTNAGAELTLAGVE